MKKPTYKVLSVFSIFLLALLFLIPTNVNAEEILDGDSAGDRNIVTIPELKQIEIGLQNATSKEKVNDLLMKKELIERSQSNANVMATYPAKTIPVPHYKQQNGYYCGPATTKQTVQYMKGTSDSQATIAKALGTTSNGTDGLKIVEYLNKRSNITWTIATDTSINGLKIRINGAFKASENRPPIVRAKFSKKGNWRYSTSGHFMNISGYTTNMAKIRVTDPNITRVDSSATGSYYVTMNEIRNAIIDHWAQHMYW